MLPGSRQGAAVREMGRLYRHGSVTGSSEADLVSRVANDRDDAAFEAIVTRYGPMVHGVCRQLLRDPNDADDAFQATFLVLMRKARSLEHCELLGNWLYGVAYRVAKRNRVQSAKRNDRLAEFQRAAAVAPDESARANLVDFETSWSLHQEVNRLPEKYRVPVILCYFEGLTHDQAAAQLGLPLGTLKGRLTRARALLQRRLGGRGIDPSALALATDALSLSCKAAVPPVLENLTLNSARAVSLHGISTSIATLVRGVSQAMTIDHIRTFVVPLFLAAATATGVVVGAAQIKGGSVDDAAIPQDPTTKASAPAEPSTADSTKTKTTAVMKKAVRRPNNQNADAQPAAGGFGGGGGMGAMMGGMSGGVGGMGGGMGGMGGMGGAGGQMSYDNRMRALRRNIALTAAELAAKETNLKSKAIHKMLEETIPFSFANPTPLDDLLKYVKQATAGEKSQGIPIYVDPKGLEEEQATLTSTVTIDVEGVPLKTTLRLALKQLNLAYCVNDGLLIISSVGGIAAELAEAQSELEAKNPTRGLGGGGFQ